MEVAHVHSVPGKPHLEEVELADGRVYQLQRARNKTGYFCVVEGRPNEYHAKPKVNGIGQVTLPGGACKTARAATLRLAIYLADPYALDVKKHEGEPLAIDPTRRTAFSLCPVPLCAEEAERRGRVH